jgi:hypothetical protein
MDRHRSNRGQVMAAAALALALVGVVAVVAINPGTSGAPASPVPSQAPDGGPSAPPVATPTPEPSAPATPAPATPAPSEQPSDDPSDGRIDVDLDTATDHDVSVVITDRSGSVVGVTSGRAGDGMSVRWFDVEVENVDGNTIRVTWVGLPRDEVVSLGISEADGTFTLDFVQDAPPANSDATGFDRVLVIAFDSPVDATDVEVEFNEAVPAA